MSIITRVFQVLKKSGILVEKETHNEIELNGLTNKEKLLKYKNEYEFKFDKVILLELINEENEASKCSMKILFVIFNWLIEISDKKISHNFELVLKGMLKINLNEDENIVLDLLNFIIIFKC